MRVVTAALCAFCVATAHLARLGAAAGVALDDGEERLPGWLGEVPSAQRQRPHLQKQQQAVPQTDDAAGSGQPPARGWVEPISWTPRAFLYHGFLSVEECEHIKQLARPRLERSLVVDIATGTSRKDDVRTSSGTFLDTAETSTVADIETRVAAWAGVPVSHQEQLQVLQYGRKQQYSDHWDFFDKSVLERDSKHNTQRIATVLMFLSEVQEGGETVFPDPAAKWANPRLQALAANYSACAHRGPSIRPRQGDAILFWSATVAGEEDPASLHASCPVVRGEKWTATKWMHSTPFKV